MNIHASLVNYTDKYGKVKIYSNGFYVFNGKDSLIPGAEKFDKYIITPQRYPTGSPFDQGNLILPHGVDSNLFYFLAVSFDTCARYGA